MELQDALATISQQTGSGFDLTNSSSRAKFLSALRNDLSKIIGQLNNVYKPLVTTLVQTNTVDALEVGLAGNSIYTDVDATSGSNELYWSSDLVRAKTIKETFDTMLTQIENLRDSISITVTPIDTSDIDAIEADVLTTNANLTQLRKDSFSPAYTLDGDGNANLTYPLAQHIQAIGALFSGFPGTSLSGWVNTYPALALEIALSDLVIDTTLAQSVITDLSSTLTAIQTFTGMTTAGDSTPSYSSHGTVTYVNNGDSLEKAIRTLDAAIANASGADTTYTYVTLLGSSVADTGIVELTTDGAAVGTGNVITFPTGRACSLFADYIFTGLQGTDIYTYTGSVTGTAIHIGAAEFATPTVVTNMAVEGSIGGGAGEQNYIYIGSNTSDTAPNPGTVPVTFENNGTGIYLKIDTGLSGVWDGPLRGRAVVRYIQLDIG